MNFTFLIANQITWSQGDFTVYSTINEKNWKWMSIAINRIEIPIHEYLWDGEIEFHFFKINQKMIHGTIDPKKLKNSD